MVDVFDVETGATLRRFPVDARALCATGQFSMTPPEPMLVAEPSGELQAGEISDPVAYAAAIADGTVTPVVDDAPVEEPAPAPKRRR
jgi:hypothetical protein